jgi:hypothetical protein
MRNMGCLFSRAKVLFYSVNLLSKQQSYMAHKTISEPQL